MKARAFVTALVFAAAILGCSTNHGKFGIAAIQRQALDADEIRQVKGDACRWFSMWGQTGGDGARSVEVALLEALSKAPDANALQDVKITDSFIFTWFYNRSCVAVEGMAIRIP